jgi:ABC-type sugar transport system permease subunit
VLLAAAAAWSGLPLTVLVFAAALDTLDPAIVAAARLDGLGAVARLRHLVWPLVRPATVRALVIALVSAANGVVLARLVTGGAPDGASEFLSTRALSAAHAASGRSEAALWALASVLLVALLSTPLAVRLRRPARPVAP